LTLKLSSIGRLTESVPACRHKRRARVFPRIAFAALSMGCTLVSPQALAQNPAQPEPPPTVHQPRESAQRTPMRVSVIDGRSFRDAATGGVYRLYGIETCETGQIAEFGPQQWPCAAVPTAWLIAATLNKWVACNVVKEGDGVRYARCASNQYPDMAVELLRVGAAVVDLKESGPLIELYKTAEAEARRNARGLWASKFEMPWADRQRQAPRSAGPPG
jgi:endonuclease YncB( thermonuclease family)